jgi:hypothetical protein
VSTSGLPFFPSYYAKDSVRRRTSSVQPHYFAAGAGAAVSTGFSLAVYAAALVLAVVRAARFVEGRDVRGA